MLQLEHVVPVKPVAQTVQIVPDHTEVHVHLPSEVEVYAVRVPELAQLLTVTAVHVVGLVALSP